MSNPDKEWGCYNESEPKPDGIGVVKELVVVKKYVEVIDLTKSSELKKQSEPSKLNVSILKY